jgi:hypothetical protein
MNDIAVNIPNMISISMPIFYFEFTWMAFKRYIFMIHTIFAKPLHNVWKSLLSIFDH